jgi:uncharacterized membrane protein (TIGR02234 family)
VTGATPARRREFTAALLAAAAGAALLAAAGTRDWATAEVAVSGPAAAAPVAVSGGDAAAAAAAMGPAGLAALAAVVATRGWARRVVGAVLAGFGAVALASVWQGTRTGTLSRLAADQVAAGGAVDALAVSAGWPVSAAAGAVLLLAAGAATAVRGPSWPGMGSRYDRHSAPRAVPGGDPAELWRSLDRGADPTLDPARPADAPPATGEGARPAARVTHDNARPQKES